MKIWLASADLKLIEKNLARGLFAGVITNPAVVAESGLPPETFFKQVCQIAPAAYYQLRAADTASMLEEARRFLTIDPEKMRIKVPATPEGFGVIRTLSDEGLPVMATIVPTLTWLVYALAAGARAIAPYGGMLQRKGIADKMSEVFRMQEIIDAQQAPAEICVGIYDATEFPLYAGQGVRSCFVWGKDVEAFLDQPLVQDALDGFSGSWQAIDEHY